MINKITWEISNEPDTFVWVLQAVSEDNSSENAKLAAAWNPYAPPLAESDLSEAINMKLNDKTINYHNNHFIIIKLTAIWNNKKYIQADWDCACEYSSALEYWSVWELNVQEGYASATICN